jgi:hypothetical protein
MRISIPHSAHPFTRVNVSHPQGSVSGDFTGEHPHFDVELPEGVTEEEVGVTVEYLTNGFQVVEGHTLKHAIAKPATPPAVETHEAPADDCECEKPADGCSTCDPADEIADPKADLSDE